ncbi:Fc receptor-like protein 4 isoform X3 [Apteryx mantelli]|uniref:Fc receptor-like protein 4 isoform X3 n=1 Tax=Apteryx mantelli TaxID=2696672 RepID=A0ABM4FXH9_9AVES
MVRSVAVLLWAQAFGLTAAQPAQLTLDPPWSPVFVEETVMLTCQGPPAAPRGPIAWYVNGDFWHKTESNQLLVSMEKPRSNSYQCQSPGSELSHPISLAFSNDWLVLQVPALAVLEGDLLPLRCRAWGNRDMSQVRFWRGRADITREPKQAELLLQAVQTSDSGRYHCTATVRHFLPSWKKSEEVLVTVQELFSAPVLSVGSSAEPLEGSNLTLSCVTRLSPLRPYITLRHLFYQDDAILAGPEDSPNYQVQAVGLADSGAYSCEVQTETASVRKRSAPIVIAVRRVPVSGVALEVQPLGGQLVQGERLVLSCSVAAGTGPISFSWHRQGRARALASSPRYEIAAARPSDGGQYHCVASNGLAVARSTGVHVTVMGGDRAGGLRLAAQRAPAGHGLGAAAGPGIRGVGPRRDLPVRGQQPAQPPAGLQGSQPGPGPLGDSPALHRRGRRGERVPPGAARCHRGPGVAPPAPAPCRGRRREGPGKDPCGASRLLGSARPRRRGLGHAGARVQQRVSQGARRGGRALLHRHHQEKGQGRPRATLPGGAGATRHLRGAAWPLPRCCGSGARPTAERQLRERAPAVSCAGPRRPGGEKAGR